MLVNIKIGCLLILVELFTSSFQDKVEFTQHGYDMMIQWVKVKELNKKYFSELKADNFKLTRTKSAQNITVVLVEDIPTIKIQVQLYKFISNEYRQFPLRVQLDLCENINSNMFGIKESIFSCGNFTLCPAKKGRNYLCNFAPNDEKFPPYIPSGMYKGELTFFSGNSDRIAQMDVIVSVTSKDPLRDIKH